MRSNVAFAERASRTRPEGSGPAQKLLERSDNNDGSRSRQSKTEVHDEDANGEADGNTDATTRWRDGGANAEADGNNDATTRCGAA